MRTAVWMVMWREPEMLEEHQRTLAPRAARVSMRTAVWMVMWREPEMLAPLKGLGGAELLDHGHETGHLDLRELNLHAAEVGLGHVADLVLAAVDGLDRAHSGGSGHLCFSFLGGRWKWCGKPPKSLCEKRRETMSSEQCLNR